MTSMYLVHTGLGSPEAAQDIAAFALQAAKAGVRRAVLLSVPAGGVLDAEPVLAAERALDEADLEWTVLRVLWFFQNFDEDFLLGPVMSGELRLPTGDGREGFIDADDIAEVAVAALTADSHVGRHYELTGPRLMTFGDTAEEIARATGRDLRYVPVTAEEFTGEQIAQGLPEEWAQMLADMYGHVSRGHLASLSNDVPSVLGRPARDFSDYARNAAEAGAWKSVIPSPVALRPRKGTIGRRLSHPAHERPHTPKLC